MSSLDLWVSLQETLKATENTVHLHRRLAAVCSMQWFIGFYNHKLFHLSYSSALKLESLVQDHMTCSIYLSLSIYIYICSIWLLTVVIHNWRSTRKYQLSYGMAACGGCGFDNFELNLELVIALVWRWTWRLTSSELRAALVGCDQASLELHLKTVIVQICRWCWNKFGNLLGSQNLVNWDIPLDAMRTWFSRCAWRHLSIEIEAVHEDGPSGWCSMGGRSNGSWDSIDWLTVFMRT